MGSLALLGVGGAPAVGVPPYDPSTVSGLVGWWKADVLALSDGTAVSSWTDSSASANHQLQATGGKQPLFKTAIQNGLPVIRYDGVDDYTRATFTLAQPFTWFMAGSWRSTTGGVEVVLGGVTGDANVQRNTSTSMMMYAGGNLPATTTPAAWHTYSFQYNGASSALRVDTALTSGNPLTNSPGGTTIGATHVPGNYGDVDVGELLAYNVITSGTDRAAIEAYLKAKWGTP